MNIQRICLTKARWWKPMFPTCYFSLKWVLQQKKLWGPKQDHAVQFYPCSISSSLSSSFMKGSLSYSKHQLNCFYTHTLQQYQLSCMPPGHSYCVNICKARKECLVHNKFCIYISYCILLLLLLLLAIAFYYFFNYYYYTTALIVRDLLQSQSRKAPITAARSAP